MSPSSSNFRRFDDHFFLTSSSLFCRLVLTLRLSPNHHRMIIQDTHRSHHLLVLVGVLLTVSCVLALDARCPARFVKVKGEYGRLNNNLLTFKSVLQLAKDSARTAVMPATDRRYPPMQEILDVNALVRSNSWCLVYESDKALKRANLTTYNVPLDSPRNNMTLNEIFTEHERYDMIVIDSDTAFHQRTRNGVIVRTDKERLALRLFTFEFYSTVDFNQQFHLFASEFISAHFTNASYVAVHLRSFEGQCRDPKFMATAQHRNNSLALTSCFIRPELVDEIIKLSLHNVTEYNRESGRLFLASDGQEKAVDDAFIRRGFVRYAMSDRAREASKKILAFDVIMDMVLLFKSSLFIGSDQSTLARFVGEMRKARGMRTVLQWPVVGKS